MTFDITEPGKIPSQKRQAIRRAVQDRLVLIAARKSGHPRGALVAKREGGWDVDVGGGVRIPLPERETRLLQDALAWEKTGEGVVPAIPLEC